MRAVWYYLVSPVKIVRANESAFTYASETELAIGSLVAVEVGRQTMAGVVMMPVEQPTFAVKPIQRTLSPAPLPLPLVQTAQWMSQYYATHLATVWQTVLPRGLLKQRRTRPAPQPTTKVRARTAYQLTADQATALDTITSMSPGTALLHGVTGSGKTLVYIEAARRVQADGLSVIVLVPEIALTTQLIDQFSAHFRTVVVAHSRQTEAERHQAWRRVIQADGPVVVIGPRSALFMPVQQLGLIVIDECHEPSFKQEQSPRYSALRVATILAQQHQAKVILGSATPSVSDYFFAQKTNRPIITMAHPARAQTVKPSISLVDMTKRQQFCQHHFLSDPLLQAIKATLDAGRQVLLFHNRRGTATITLCRQCGWSAGCPRCFVPLTLHADHHQLICHICGFTSHVPTSCPECHQADVLHKGLGTKRIETAIRQLFPHKTIARFDADTPPSETADRRYAELYNGSIDIIIGTQVIAKGFDLPQLRTVGIVQADTGLDLPDFAAAERTFQLLAQAVGRVGRSRHPTQVIVQSYQPHHPAIRDGISQRYQNFFQRTIAQRQATNFPPFVHLLQLTCVYKTERSAISQAQKLAATLRSQAADGVEILGPTPAFYERVRDTYRWQLLIKSPQRHQLIALLQHLPPTHWQFELDPTSLL